ncbi:hypothetical protein [Oceanobacillus luteolus]|uniref:Uncharacterized protein n=1 Tax=Oceanobacillus luteolus TaxID=1274358 RepID=A0ABW4HX36_9BACI
MNYGSGTELLMNQDGKKVFISNYNEASIAYFFNELSVHAKYIAAKGLTEDSKLFEFNDGSDTIMGAYFSLKDSESNLFNENGILLSNGGGYV